MENVLQIINVVWGEKYINTFLNLSLPTQFSSGNLTALSTKPNYILYTDEEGQAQIMHSPIYKKLSEACQVIFRLIVVDMKKCFFDTLLKCHSDAIKQANKTRSPIVLLAPDCILSTGVFSYLENALKRKIRLLTICSSRMSLEKYQAIVGGKKEASSDRVDWSPTELATTLLHNLHHRAKCLFVEGNTVSIHPSHMYWKLDDNNVLAKAYHLHPLLIWPEKRNVVPTISADGKEFLEKICPNYEHWEVLTDCKQMSLFEISSEEQFTSDTTHEMDPEWFQYWIRLNVSDAHRFFLRHDIILGDGNRKPEWDKIIHEAHKKLIEFHTFHKKEEVLQQKEWKCLKRLEKIAGELRYFIRCYLKLFFLVITGKKKITFRKICYHLQFLIKMRAFPLHTLDLRRKSKK